MLNGNQNLKNQYEIAGSHVSPFPRDYIIGRDGKMAYASDEYDPEAMLAVIKKELTPTSVLEWPTVGLPQEFSLSANYPNPFLSAAKSPAQSGGNPETHIDYRVGKASHVLIQVYDLDGRLLQTLVDQQQNPGRYSTSWNGCNAEGRTVASGLYLIHMRAGSFHARRSISFLK